MIIWGMINMINAISKQNIISNLEKMQESLMNTAKEMQDVFREDDDILLHAAQMRGAAILITTWIKEIKNDR